MLISTLFLTVACGGKATKGKTTTNDNENGKKEIVVGTSGSPKPFTFVDGSNELTGYDIEMVKAIFEKLPDYDIAFEKTEFTSVLAGLDTNRYQIGANNFAMNDERKEKYIYSDPIFKNQYVIAISEKVSGIESFADLNGKSTEVSPGLNYATALENYNKENPDEQVKIDYSETELLNVLQSVESGKYDFQLIDKAMGQQFIDEHQLKLKLVDLSKDDSDRIGTPYSYLLFSKTQEGEKLSEQVNEALKKVIDTGKASEISKQFLGGDFAPQ